jgi:hypothetical protein
MQAKRSEGPSASEWDAWESMSGQAMWSQVTT